jgi:hypothetical protein
MSRLVALAALAALGGLAGCSRPQEAVASPGQATATKAVSTGIARVVLVGRENACECTRKSIEATSKALAAAMGQPARLPVERLAIDVDRERVAALRAQKPMMALPALYFLDAKGRVVTLLQGEQTEAQIRRVLKGAES